MSFKKVTELFGLSIAEDATAEEIIAAFDGIENVNSHVVAKSLYDKAASDTAKYKKEARELRAAANAEPTPMEKELAALKTQLKTRELTESFMDSGFDKASAQKMAAAISDPEGDMTDLFTGINDHIVSVRTAAQKQLMNDTPAPTGGAEKPNVITPDAFRAMSPADKQSLLTSNPNAFSQLREGQSVQLD